MAEWFRAPAISSREVGDVGSSPSPAKIPFSDEFFLNNSRVDRQKIGRICFNFESVLEMVQTCLFNFFHKLWCSCLLLYFCALANFNHRTSIFYCRVNLVVGSR